MLTIEPPSHSLDLPIISKSSLTRFINRARTLVGLVGHIDVLLTSDAKIKRLNQQFRGKRKPTDVLSFPAAQEAIGIAGDLAISFETAQRQAEEHGHSLRDELRILLLHGLLHLAGEDHEIDSGRMAAREEDLRKQLRLPTSLIERSDPQRRPLPRRSRLASGPRP